MMPTPKNPQLQAAKKLDFILIQLWNKKKIKAVSVAEEVLNVKSGSLSKARNTWKKTYDVNEEVILDYLVKITEFYGIKVTVKTDARERKPLDSDGFYQYEIEFSPDRNHQQTNWKYYVYYYVNRDNKCATGLLALEQRGGNNLRCKAILYTYKGEDVRKRHYTYEGVVTHNRERNKFTIFFEREKKGTENRGVSTPSFCSFEEPYERLQIGTFSSSGNITSCGLVVIEALKKGEEEHFFAKKEADIPAHILYLIKGSRNPIPASAALISSKQLLAKFVEARAGIYLAYTLRNTPPYYLKETLIRISKNGEVLYTMDSGSPRSGRVVDLINDTLLVIVFPATIVTSYADTELILDINNQVALKHRQIGCLTGTYGGIDTFNRPMAGRIILFRDEEDAVIHEPSIKRLDEAVKSLNERFSERGKIIKEFFKGGLDEYADSPEFLEQHPQLLNRTYDHSSISEMDFSDNARKFDGYYYSEETHDIHSFELTIEKVGERYLIQEHHFYFDASDRYIGTGEYQNETMFISLRSEEADYIYMILYTGRGPEKLNFMFAPGAYLGVSPNNNDRVAGEFILVKKETGEDPKTKLAVERYLFAGTKNIQVAGVTKKLPNLQIDNRHSLNVISHLVGDYWVMSVNRKGIYIVSHFKIRDNYRSTLDSPISEESQPCKIAISNFNGIKQLFVTSYDGVELRANTINSAIIRIPAKGRSVKFLEGVYGFAGDSIAPFASYLIFYKTDDLSGVDKGFYEEKQIEEAQDEHLRTMKKHLQELIDKNPTSSLGESV